MIQVMFYEKKNPVSSKYFNDDTSADELNQYISKNWKSKLTWKVFKDGRRISFKKLFHTAFIL